MTPDSPDTPKPDLSAKRQAAIAANRAQWMVRLEQHGRVRYAAGLLDGVAALLQPGDVVIDCGANVGVVSSVLVATGATVHAFEPDPHAGDILQGKFGHLPNFTLHRVAVGVAAGTATFYRSEKHDEDPNRSGLGNTIFEEHRFVQRGPRATVQVEIIDFVAFLTGLLDGGARVPFVKIDVEGAELAILRHMLEQGLFDRVSLTVAETHEEIIPDWADDYAALRCDVAARYPKTRVNLDWI